MVLQPQYIVLQPYRIVLQPYRIVLQSPSPAVAGTDTKKFNRTPEMAVEALKRYPCATPDKAFVVGCIGSYEEGK